MMCKHLETIECTCGECQSCPAESRGRECAECGVELYDCAGNCGDCEECRTPRNEKGNK